MSGFALHLLHDWQGAGTRYRVAVALEQTSKFPRNRLGRKFFDAVKLNPKDQISIRIVAQMDEWAEEVNGIEYRGCPPVSSRCRSRREGTPGRVGLSTGRGTCWTTTIVPL